MRNLHDARARVAQRGDARDIPRRVLRIRFEQPHRHPAQRLLVEPGKRAAGMGMGFEDHLVARIQLQPRGDDRVALARVAHERNLLRLRAEKARQGRAGAREQSVPVLAAHLELAGGLLDPRQGRQRRGPEPAGVEVGVVARQRKLVPHRRPEGVGRERVKGRQRGRGRSP